MRPRREPAAPGRRAGPAVRLAQIGPAGFSLVELMVVIVVMTVLAGVLVPDFTGDRDEAKLRSAGRELIGALRFAASSAATLNREHRLVVDVRTGRFWLEARDERREFRPLPDSLVQLDPSLRIDLRSAAPRRPDPESTAEPPPGPPTEEDVRRYGGFVNTEDDRIYFWPDGTADAREVLIQSRDLDGILLVVNPTTARVSFTRVGPDGLPLRSLADPRSTEPDDEPDDDRGEADDDAGEEVNG